MTKKCINHLLVIMACGMAVIILLAGGLLPAIWNGIVPIVKNIIPNWWTLLAYAHVGTMCFLFGMKAGMKNMEKKK